MQLGEGREHSFHQFEHGVLATRRAKLGRGLHHVHPGAPGNREVRPVFIAAAGRQPGMARQLAAVPGNEIADALRRLWGDRTPATWNRNRAALASWLNWCATRKRRPAPQLPGDAERRREHSDRTRALPRGRVDRLLSRRDIPLREKALWRMLYETARPRQRDPRPQRRGPRP